MARKHPPPWLFGVSLIPYGVVGSFSGQVMPYMTQRAGMKLDVIGLMGSLLLVPPMLQFLYAPIVDIGLKRKHWLIVVAALGAACLVTACLMPLPEHTTPFLVFAVASQLISGLVGSCAGGILSVVMPDDVRGRASAWFNVGNLSGGAISAAVAIWMIGEKFDPLYIGLALGLMMIVPAFAVLWIDEPPRDNIQAASEVFATTYRDLKAVIASKSGITGILLCISPVGTAALVNYFSGMSDDYHARAGVVTLVNGPANAALTAIGAFAGGWLCDRYNRRAMYLLSGALTALSGIAMALSPRTEATYAWGVCLYFLVTGFCFSAFTATVLETIGKAGKAASAQYALFVAAGNAAINYVGLVDTRFNERHGVEGVIGADVALNVAGVLVLGLAFWRLGLLRKRVTPQEAGSSPASPAPASTQ